MVLNAVELSMLELWTLNLPFKDIEFYLGLTKTERLTIMATIKHKLKSNNSYDTIVNGFKYHLLDPYDYVHEIVKKQVLKAVDHLVCHYKSGVLKESTVNEVLEAMQTEIQQELKSFHKANMRGITLLAKEQQYLNLMFEGKSPFYISKVLQLSLYDIYVVLKQDVFKKLKVNSMYNAYRKALDLGMLWEVNTKKNNKILLERLNSHIMSSLGHFPAKVDRVIMYHDIILEYNLIQQVILHKQPYVTLVLGEKAY